MIVVCEEEPHGGLGKTSQVRFFSTRWRSTGAVLHRYDSYPPANEDMEKTTTNVDIKFLEKAGIFMHVQCMDSISGY